MKDILNFFLSFIKKYREIIFYGIFGVLTTIVNWVFYVLFMTFLTGRLANLSASAGAWVIAVLFAYLTNRKWVFESRVNGFYAVSREALYFFSSRILSGVLDMGIMLLFADVLLYNGKIVKLLSNIFVIIINYILSKFLIFKGAQKQ